MIKTAILRGRNGPPGASTTVDVGGFTQPAVGASVVVPVKSTYWMAVGQWLYVVGAGYMQIAALPDASHATLTNWGSANNAAPGTAIAAGAVVALAGPSGADGVMSGVFALGATEVTVNGTPTYGESCDGACVVQPGVPTTDGTTWANFGEPYTFPALTSTGGAGGGPEVACMKIFMSTHAQNQGPTGGTTGNAYGLRQAFHLTKSGTANPAVSFTDTLAGGGDADLNTVAVQLLITGNVVQPQVRGVASRSLKHTGVTTMSFGS